MTNSIFIMYSLSVDGYLKNGLTQSACIYLSSLEKVEEYAENYLQAYSFMYGPGLVSKDLYCLVAEEYAIDDMYPKKMSVHVYSPDGKLLSCSLFPEGDIPVHVPDLPHKHRVGDIVEAPCGDSLYLGIVLEQPLALRDTPDCYMKYPEDCYSVITYPSMEIDYIHSPLVFKPKYGVNKQVEEDLQLALKQHLT